jgi:hypothetical protein
VREAADRFARESVAKVGSIQNANKSIIDVNAANAAVDVPDTSPIVKLTKRSVWPQQLLTF